MAGTSSSASVTPNANACAVSRPTTPRGGALLTARWSARVRRRAQTRHERRDHAVGELGPVGEKVVEHGLVDAQDEGLLEHGHRRASAAAARARRARRQWCPARARRSVRSPRCTRTRPSTMANRCASTAPSSMSTVSGLHAHLGGGLGDGASTRPGTPANRSTRCSAATRSTSPSEPAGLRADIRHDG